MIWGEHLRVDNRRARVEREPRGLRRLSGADHLALASAPTVEEPPPSDHFHMLEPHVAIGCDSGDQLGPDILA